MRARINHHRTLWFQVHGSIAVQNPYVMPTSDPDETKVRCDRLKKILLDLFSEHGKRFEYLQYLGWNNFERGAWRICQQKTLTPEGLERYLTD